MSGKKSKEKRKKKEKESKKITWYDFIANHWDELKNGLGGWLPPNANENEETKK